MIEHIHFLCTTDCEENDKTLSIQFFVSFLVRSVRLQLDAEQIGGDQMEDGSLNYD